MAPSQGEKGRNRRQLPSGTVFGVDAHVFVGQVSGPQGFAAGAAIQLDTDGDFRLLHDPGALLFGVAVGTAALAGNADIIQVDVNQLHIQILDPGIADGREDTPPVRVRGKQGGLDQRRMGDCVGHIQALVAVATAVDLNGDELGRAFTVAHDELGQFAHHCIDRLRQGSVFQAVDVGDFGHVRLIGGDQHAAVVGAGIAINGDAIEGLVSRLLEHILQQRLTDARIGNNIAEHGCHIRPDHAGALGDTGDGDCGTGQVQGTAAALGQGVGGHDAAGGSRPVVRAQVRQGIRQRSNRIKGSGTYIGIYWPDGVGKWLFLPTGNYSDPKEMQIAVSRKVRASLLSQRTKRECTWSNLQELIARHRLQELKDSGSNDINEYIRHFDAEMASKDEEIQRLEAELARAKYARQLPSGVSNTDGTNLALASTERDLYQGERLDIIIDSLKSAADAAEPHSRRRDVLTDIIKQNAHSGEREQILERLKQVLRQYDSMTASVRAELESLGFAILEDGKHYKLILHEDSRYPFILAKTGGDWRGGLNAFSDLKRRIF